MPALFAITRITRLARARLVLLEGELREGALQVGRPAVLEAAGVCRPVQVRGVLGMPGGVPGKPAGPVLLQVTLAARGLTDREPVPGDHLRQG